MRSVLFDLDATREFQAMLDKLRRQSGQLDQTAACTLPFLENENKKHGATKPRIYRSSWGEPFQRKERVDGKRHSLLLYEKSYTVLLVARMQAIRPQRWSTHDASRTQPLPVKTFVEVLNA